MPQLFDFTWFKPANGWAAWTYEPDKYDIEPGYNRIRAKPGVSTADRQTIERFGLDLAEDITGTQRLTDRRENQWTFLLPKRGPMISFKPLEVSRAIFMEFAAAEESVDAAIRFLGDYGPIYGHSASVTLVRRGNERVKVTEDAPKPIRFAEFQEEAAEIRRLIDQWHQAEEIGDYGIIAELLDNQADYDYWIHEGDLIDIRLRLVPGQNRPRLVLQPAHLLAAAYIQLMQAISGDFQIAKCSWCPNWFCYGVGTGRRRSSLYCSDRCRKAAHRAGYKRG